MMPRAYRKLMAPLVADWDKLAAELLGPFRLPRHPLTLARFGLGAIRSARGLAESLFKGERARALFAGIGAPLDATPGETTHCRLRTDSGNQRPCSRLAGASWRLPKHQRPPWPHIYVSLGGETLTSTTVESVDKLPSAHAVLLDITPRQVIQIAGDQLPRGYQRKLQRYRYATAPGRSRWTGHWTAPSRGKATECGRAGTVHLGGTIAEIAAAERAVWSGQHPERPFVLLAQQSLFDPTRAPEGKHTAWAYCHVPNGSTFDMADRIEGQIERFAPGFRDLILGRSAMSPARLEEYNPNYVGGDINGGVQDLRQHFARPTLSLSPYATPGQRALHLLSLHATGRWSTWHVRPLRSPGGPAQGHLNGAWRVGQAP